MYFYLIFLYFVPSLATFPYYMSPNMPAKVFFKFEIPVSSSESVVTAAVVVVGASPVVAVDC
jgi:hypothetical protein